MSETSKKALLDTDFLFKTQLAQNRNREPLADLIMQFDVLPPHARDFSRELGGLYACEIRTCMV